MHLIQLFFISLCISLVSGETPLFENQSVIKTVDLSEAIVKVTLRFSIKPMEQTLNEYYVGIPKNEMDHLAFISANNGKSVKMTIKKADVENESFFYLFIMYSNDIQLFKVISKEPFEEKSVIYVEYYLTHVLESLPAFAAQVQYALYSLTRMKLHCLSIVIRCWFSLLICPTLKKFVISYLKINMNPSLKSLPRKSEVIL